MADRIQAFLELNKWDTYEKPTELRKIPPSPQQKKLRLSLRKKFPVLIYFGARGEIFHFLFK